MKRGEIYYIDGWNTVGSEVRKTRPGIIVSNDTLNATSEVVEVVYLTTKPKKAMPTHVSIKATGLSSTALCENIDHISKLRVGDFCGTCSEEEMTAIDEALRVSLGLKTPEPKPKQEAQSHDPVNNPSHYTTGRIEVIDFIEDKGLGFHLGNAVKYIARAGKKDPTKTVEDLQKAMWYLTREIKKREAQADGRV